MKAAILPTKHPPSSASVPRDFTTPCESPSILSAPRGLSRTARELRPPDDVGYREAAAPTYPWERQVGEGAKAFEAFTIFRDLGPERSFIEVARSLDKGGELVRRWAQEHKWDARVAEYDADLERKVLKKKEDVKIEMIERHAVIARQMLDIVTERLRTVKPDQLDASELARWMDLGVKIERLSRGQPSEEANRALAGIVNIIWEGAPPPWANKSKILDAEVISESVPESE